MQRSLAYFRKAGDYAEIVEHYNAFSRTRKDLFGWADILVLQPLADGVVHILAVQTTTKSNMKARQHKIEDSATIDLVRKAGIEVYVHGWGKSKTGKWEVSVVDLS